MFKISIKLDLSYNSLLYENEIYNILNEDNYNYEYNNKEKLYNPFYNLLDNYENIKKIISQKDMKVLEYLYLNRKKVNKILFEEENLFIDHNIMNKFSDYYYLYMLIKDMPEIKNYTYNFELIQNVYDMILFSKGTLKKIILAKITLLLIENNYDSILENVNQNKNIMEQKYEEMKYNCIKIINYNKTELMKYKHKLDLNLDELDSNGYAIDELYTSILVSLIKNNILDDLEEAKNLLDEIEIKNIRLNKSIFDGLKNVLTKNYLSKYLISTYDDLFKEEKLKFYSILFLFILKSSDYVFHIPFLLETRTQIVKIINENIQNFASDLTKEKSEKNIITLKEILEFFIELNYYINKSKKAEKNKFKNLKISIPSNPSNPSNISNSSSPSDMMESLDDHYPDFYHNFSLNEKELIRDSLPYKLLTNSTFIISVEYKEGKNEAFISYKKINCEFYKQNFEIEFVKSLKSDNIELNINYGKFVHFLEMIESELKSNYKIKKKIEIELKFKSIYNYDINYNIDCYYTIKDNNFEETEFKDEKILNIKDGKFYGFIYMIAELNEY